MSNVLECPFCGEQVRTQENGFDKDSAPTWWEIACDTCDFTICYRDTEQDAIAAWNTRIAPRVKPLVWEFYEAHVLGLHYRVMIRDGEWAATCFTGLFEFRPIIVWQVDGLPSEGAAKEACQLEFGRRIKGFLE